MKRRRSCSLLLAIVACTAAPAAHTSVAADRDHVLGPDGPSGVLSPASLVGMRVTFDYPRQQMRTGAGSLPPADGRTIFQWEGDRQLPTVPVPIGTRQIPARIDSGATGGLTLPRSWAAELIAAVVTLLTAGHPPAAAPANSQDPVDGFAARSYRSRTGATLPYRLFVPSPDARRDPLPLIIYLHGGGGAGTDNLKQISGGNTLGTHLWTTPAMQARHPAFVLAPQLPGDEQWSAPASDDLAAFAALALEAMADVSREFAIDPDRVYLTGQSRGGRGVWDIVSKRPHLFAAAVPLCGDGQVARITQARTVPIWAFHGARDDVVPVEGSRALVAALRASKGSVRYTEYPDTGHNVWTLAYAEPELPTWLFAQRR